MWEYGITACEYTKMRILQNDACAICGSVGDLHIDHDHATGKIRGLLCGKCNRGLGQFEDSVEHMRSAVEYLTRQTS